MKKYPNNTMVGELQDRLLQLKRAPLALKQKIVDLEKMLLIADLQRKLQHQRSVSASLPSSSSMKSCVKKTEAQLAAAVLLAPEVEHAPDPGQEEAAQQDGVRDVREEALRQLTEAGLFPLGSPAQQLQSQSQVLDLQTKMERLQSKVAQLQYTVPISAAVPVAPNKTFLVYPSGSYGRVAASSHRTPILIRICQLELYNLFIEGLNTEYNRI